jgi:hypothetical protein
MSRLLLVLLLLLPAGLLTACGGEDRPSTPQGVLQDTFGEDHPIRSGDLRLGLDLDLQGVQGLEGPVRVALRGPFQTTGERSLPKFAFTLDLGAGGQTLRAGAISTGDRGFVTFQGQAFELPAENLEQLKRGYAQSQSQRGSTGPQGPSFGSLGIRPLTWLTDPKDAGTEDVGGTATRHVTAGVDVPRLLTDVSRLLDRAEGLQIEGAGEVPGGLTAAQRRQITDAVRRARLDVWSGKDDGTLRRLRLVVDLDGKPSGRIALDVTIAGLNSDQDVQAPEGARPLSELTGAAGLPGLGGDAAGSGGATGAAGAAAQAPQAYLDCVGRAGQDVARLQDCARFLTR